MMDPRRQFEPFQKLGDKIFRVPRIEPWRIPLALVRAPKFHSVSVAVLIWGFAVLIAIGAVLLMLPISSQDHTWTSFPDALFTAVAQVLAYVYQFNRQMHPALPSDWHVPANLDPEARAD